MLTILAGVATWKREIMLERQREGIAKAKSEGKYKRRPTSIDLQEVVRLPRRWDLPQLPSNSGSPDPASTGCWSWLARHDLTSMEGSRRCCPVRIFRLWA